MVNMIWHKSPDGTISAQISGYEYVIYPLLSGRYAFIELESDDKRYPIAASKNSYLNIESAKRAIRKRRRRLGI